MLTPRQMLWHLGCPPLPNSVVVETYADEFVLRYGDRTAFIPRRASLDRNEIRAAIIILKGHYG
ncbi:hypothetical protein PLANPX_4083 [Lacipirellula parvula]|uniref:Uncharacterized protein n=1 Tax=Lacipirellula parvula TaxID=2650471 RepID=A0A5K7XHN8_9BACT|nr:hypothetical protein PLANPX_4083 [Lacipirellula parvula]